MQQPYAKTLLPAQAPKKDLTKLFTSRLNMLFHWVFTEQKAVSEIKRMTLLISRIRGEVWGQGLSFLVVLAIYSVRLCLVSPLARMEH